MQIILENGIEDLLMHKVMEFHSDLYYALSAIRRELRDHVNNLQDARHSL